MAHNVDMKPFGVLLFIGVLFSIAPPSYSYNSHIGVDLGHGAPENTTYHESESGQKFVGDFPETSDNTIVICAPQDRENELGVLTFGADQTVCDVALRGKKGRGEDRKKGDTPSGEYTASDLRRSIKPSKWWRWKGTGIELTQTKADPGSREPKGLFIHMQRKNATDISQARSHGCPIVTEACMEELREFYKRKNGEIKVHIREHEECGDSI